VATWLVDVPHTDLERCRVALLDLRDVVQELAGRAADRIAPELWEDMAPLLGLPDAAAVQLHVRTLGRRMTHLSRLTWRRVDSVLRRPPKAAAGRRPQLESIGGGLAVAYEEIVLDRDARPTEDPCLLLRAAAEHGIALAPGWIARAAQTVDGGGAALASLLAAHPDVTAVFAFNDVIAIGALREARRFGLRVPDDLAVIGFDGLALGTLVDPELSSVAIDTRALGALAVEQAARLVTGAAPLEPGELVVRAGLHLRESA